MARKQTELEGMETPSVEEIEKLADAYVSVRDQRMTLTKQETEKRTLLLDAMHRHKLESYNYDGYTVFIDKKEKVKVKTATDDDDNEGQQDEEESEQSVS